VTFKVRSGKTFGVDCCKYKDNDASTTRITILNAEGELISLTRLFYLFL